MLDKGTPRSKEERIAHRKQYKIEHQREKRTRVKEINVYCPKEKYESLKKRAEKFKRTIGAYLFDVEDAQHRNMRLDPNPKSTKAISRDILMVRMMLEDLIEEDTHNQGFQEGLMVLKSIEELIRDLLNFGPD